MAIIVIIIGIDPGTATTGYGVIKKEGESLECMDYGIIETGASLKAPERLKILSDDLTGLIKKYNPEIMAVESIYFFKNAKTVISVSQARGVILLAGAKKKIPICEFTPLQMKMAITGYGKADKKQIQKMVKILLNLEELPKPDDAADGLAIAICCARDIKGITEKQK